MDGSAKRGEALTKAKFSPEFIGFPRLVIDGLVNRRIRKDMQKKRMSTEEAIIAQLMCTVIANEFCVRYPLLIQLECAQRLGGRIQCEVYTGDLCTDLRESIRDACFSKAKCAGFDADTFRPRKRGGPSGSAGRPSRGVTLTTAAVVQWSGCLKSRLLVQFSSVAHG